MVLDDLVDGTPESGISMLSLQRILEIKTYKTVWTMGHKIRQAMAERDANYKLAGLIEMDETYFGAPKPGKRGGGAAGKAKVVVAGETPADKLRFAAMRMVPRVSSNEIQPLVRERLAAEAVIKTDGWQGYSFLDAAPNLQHEWLVPGSGQEVPKVLPWVHTLIANIKGNIRGIHHGVSPKHLPPGGILLPVQPPLLGTANVQPDDSCLHQLGSHHLFRAKGRKKF